MKKIICTIINNSGSIQTGDMIEDNNITEEFFINWIYRNCKGCDAITIAFNPILITVYYNSRTEIYYFKEV